jgi:eukaryotic-like serine/threonine-protein kinase
MKQPVSLLLNVADTLQDPVPFLIRVQRAHPTDFWANYELANSLRSRGKASESIRYYQAALSLRPEIPAAHVTFGNALSVVGRPEEALHEYREAVRLDPRLASGWEYLSAGLSNANKHTEAVAAAREGLRFSPDSVQLRVALADALMKAADVPEALRECQAVGSWRRRRCRLCHRRRSRPVAHPRAGMGARGRRPPCGQR